MRLFVLLGVDVALILLATLLGFVLRGNLDVTQTEFVAFLPYLCATHLRQSFLFRLPVSIGPYGDSAVYMSICGSVSSSRG